MAKKRECFWCVYERVENQTYIPNNDDGNEVVTAFEGTPVCLVHACWIGREVKRKVEERTMSANA